MLKRIISLIAALTLTVGLLPGAVFAREETETVQVLTAYSASAITVDGSILEEGWLVIHKIGTAGTFGAQWQKDALFLAVETGTAKMLNVNLNGKSFSVSLENLTATGALQPEWKQSGRVLELRIPFASLDFTADYDAILPMTIGLDGVSVGYDLCLSVVDWFNVENAAHPLVARYTGSAKVAGSSVPTANQGVEKISGGYRYFDLYDPEGNNPTQIRSVTLFDNIGAEFMADRGFGVYVEFDFYASSMPIYTAQEATDWSPYYGAYGFCWAFADSGPNMVRMGIYNTADGLVYAVRDGSSKTTHIPLNKNVGDRFRVGAQWQASGDLVITVDGQTVGTVKNAHFLRSGIVKSGVVFSIIRSATAAAKSADSIDLTVTNVAAGKLVASAVPFVPYPDNPTPSEYLTAFSGEGITVDGVLKEEGWLTSGNLTRADGYVMGTFGAQWTKEGVYLAVDPNRSAAVELSLGEKSALISTEKLTVTGSMIPAVARSASDDVLELYVPYSQLGLETPEYGTKLPVTIKLDSGSYTGQLLLSAVDWVAAENPQYPFTAYNTASRKMGSDDPTENQGSEKINGGYRFFDMYDPNGSNPAQVLSSATYSLPGFEARGYGAQLEFDFHAKSMPVYIADTVKNWSRYYAVYGFNACLAESYVDGQANVVRTGIFNTADGLVFAVKSSGGDVHVPLGKKVGDIFRMSLQWQADGDLLIFVDGVLLDTVGSCHVKMGGFMTNALSFNVVRSAAPAESAGDNIDVSVTNVAVGKLTAYAEVYVPEPGAAAPALIHTAFSEEEIIMDGSIAQHGWVMNGSVRNSAGLVMGTFGAQWREEGIYLAIDPNNAKTVGVKLGNKAFSFRLEDLQVTGDLTPAALVRATDNDTLELSVSFESLGITITDYNTLIPITVTLDEDSYEGQLKLTSVDWFGTENELLNLGAGSVGSTNLGASLPTANQGSEPLKTGWHMYDLYDPEGNNPEKVRSYVILWRDSVYDPLADRSRSTYAEFDLKVASMPVYTAKEAVGWSVREACHGFSWWLADYNNGTRNSNIVSLGVFNSAQGLVLAVQRNGDTPLTFQLNRQVGDQLRLGTAWRTDGTLTVYLDGVEFVTVEKAEYNVSSYGSMTLGFNLVRSETPAAAESDSMDVYITNIALGKSYDDSLLDALTWNTIRGENEKTDEVVADLTLPASLSNTQLTQEKPLTWTSSDPEVISADGKVTRPASGFREVTLTATLPDGTSKAFFLVVAGLDNSSGNVLVISKDYNPAKGVGAQTNTYAFTLDEDNKSVIIDLEQKQPVSVVALKDGDTAARLNENVLTLWVSDDNVTYTQVKGFKLLHRGQFWYLYNFASNARFVKVHCTHFDGTEADFTGPVSQMITAWDDPLLDGGGSFAQSQIAVTNATGVDRYDYPWVLEGVTAQRVLLDGEILYHYVNGSDTVARIPYIRAGEQVTLTVLTGNESAMDISNKEYVYEVAYGTREARPVAGEARMVVALKNGTLVSIGGNGLGTGMQRSFSYDNGMTWTVPEMLECTLGFIAEPGGFIYDTVTGRVYFQGCWSNGFVADNKEESDGKVGFIYSDDGGVTWQKLGYLEMEHTYGLSYSDGVMLGCYDGMGPNVDFVLNVHVQYNNTGSFACTVAYSTDAGNTWQVSDSVITFGNEAGYEGGVSEATILERDDGTLVLYARCQFADSDHFAQSYSYDHGITWVEQSKHTQVYTGGTQPIMYRYDEAPVLIWGGNHMQGGTSGIRAPLTMGVSYDGMETFRNLQNLYAKYSLQGLSAGMQNRVTNPTAQKVGQDSFLSVWWCQGRVNTTLQMRIDDFTDYFYRTKGAYDSFEHGTVRYEGWDIILGSAEISGAYATDGSCSMELADVSAVRSVPYIQNGTVTLDLYCPGEKTNLSMEFQSAYTNIQGKGAPFGFVAEDNVITFLGAESGSGLQLQQGRNRLSFTLEMDSDAPAVWFSLNGSQEVPMPVNTDIGDYVCYILIANTGTVYLDNLLVADDQDAEIYKQSAEGAVMQKIASIGTVTLDSAERIAAARAAYEALTDGQKALVTNYETLLAAEKALRDLQEAALPGFGINLVLNETIDMNLIPKGGVALEGNVISLTYADGSTAQYTIAAVNGSPAVRHSFNADQMSETVTIQIFDAQGTPLTKKLTISVRDYVGKLLSVTRNDTEKALMIRLLDYGALAQIYGARAAGETVQAADLANSIITSDLRAFMNSYDMGTPESYNPNMVSTGGTFSANLTLNESVDMNVYVDPGKMLENEKIVVKLGDQVLTEGQYKQGVTADGKIAIRYSFNADRMNEELTVALADETSGDVRISLTMSVRKLAYVSMLSYSSDTVLCATFAALLDYGALAQQYGGTNTDDLANRYVTADQRKLLSDYPWPTN